MNGGGSPKVVHTLGGGLAKGVLGVYKGGGWVKKSQKRAYVICTRPLTNLFANLFALFPKRRFPEIFGNEKI